MSRLYIKKATDMSKTGSRASETANVEIYWGNANDPMLAISVTCQWIKGDDKPTLLIKQDSDLQTRIIKQAR